jgi:hypothetical protein
VFCSVKQYKTFAEMGNKSIMEVLKENVKGFCGAEPTDECNRYGIINPGKPACCSTLVIRY